MAFCVLNATLTNLAICIKPLIINIDFSVETIDYFSLLIALGLL